MKSMVLPHRQWEILVRLAVSGPLNAGKIAKGDGSHGSELRSSTVNKCVTKLLSRHLIILLKSHEWRTRRIPVYALAPTGLSILLSLRENWTRLREIFQVNSQLFRPSYQKKLLNAWGLTHEIPPEIVDRVMDLYVLELRLQMGVAQRAMWPNESKEGLLKLTQLIPPDPYNMLLNALLHGALSETNPHLMFETQQEKKRIKEFHRKPVFASDPLIQAKVRLPDWFHSVVRKAYLQSELYGDLITLMRLTRDESKARVAIISRELRKLPSAESAMKRELHLGECCPLAKRP